MCKRFNFLLKVFLFGALSSCNLLDGDLSVDGLQDEQSSDKAVLSIRFSGESDVVTTKSGSSIQIDTNSFILSVTGSDGSVLYDGLYCEAPVSLVVKPGAYEITVVSDKFSKPAFDSPVWGDQQCVTVKSGETSIIDLLCRQMNSGVRMTITKDFLTSYPNSSLLLKSAEGKLLYSYSEKRTAFFQPGTVSLMMSTGAKDELLLSRNLCSGEILSLRVNVASSASSSGAASKSGIRIQVDTSRTYIDETFVIGGGTSGGSKGKEWSNAYTIAGARTAIGLKSVWVGGYIVGGDLTTAGISFNAPFKSASNLAIGPKSNTANRADCLSVQLQSGDIRDEINLVSNPSLLHKYVYLKGDIVGSYFGLVGIKNVTDYKLK